MKENNTHQLGDLFKSLVKENKLKPKLHEAKLRDSWPSLMGKLVNDYTTDISLRKKTLFLRITSAPLKNELVMSKPKLIKLLNQKLGEAYIENIVIR